MVSGLVDAVSILRLDRVFVANMTGNVVFVGLGLARARGFSIGVSLTALAGFVAGAAGATVMPRRWQSDRATLLRTSAMAKTLFAAPVVGVAAVFGIAPNRPVVYLFTAALAISMGIQNALVARLGVPDLTTTVLTTTLTRLVVDVSSGKWRRPENAYRGASVACLLLGALVGAVLVRQVNAVSALALGLLLLAAVGMVAHSGAVRRAAWTAFPE